MDSGDAADIARALRQLSLDRLQDEVTEARQIAERRSGERGLAARQALVAAEARLAAAQAELGAAVGAEEEHGAMGAAQVRYVCGGRWRGCLRCTALVCLPAE